MSPMMLRAMRTRPALLAIWTLVLSAGLADSASAVDLSGDWCGRWESCTTGHSGRLRADFCRQSESSYRVEFRGTFFKIVPFRYHVTLRIIEETDDQVTLAGDSYLGRLAGTFTYSATANEREFVADYRSCKDQGRFVLCRSNGSCSGR